jgi:Predicted AAA-ATPase.
MHFTFPVNLPVRFFFQVDRLLVNKSLSVTKRDLKKWYSGYNVGGKELYNPWSVLNCIHNGGKLAPYFTNMP